MPNQKKRKHPSNSDATVLVSNIQSSSHEKVESSKKINYSGLYIESQGEDSIKSKLNRIMTVNDMVVLLKDFPDDLMYTGYLCTIIDVLGQRESDGEMYYEIEFESGFKDSDLSRKSKERNSDFEFPVTHYTTYVSRKDIVRLETQDLYYNTFFS